MQKTTNRERKDEEVLELAREQFDVSPAVMDLIPPEVAMIIVKDHCLNREWEDSKGNPRTVCSIHRIVRGPGIQRGASIVTLTAPDHRTTLLLTVAEIIPLVRTYLEIQAKGDPDNYLPEGSFLVGRVVKSRGVELKLSEEDYSVGMFRHLACDWGDIGEEDWQANNLALDHARRIFSSYHDANGRKFNVQTEADRSSTTVFFPDEN